MVPPFLAVMGEMDESMKQIRGFIRHLYDAENSLFFHIKDVACDKYIRKVHQLRRRQRISCQQLGG